MANPVLRHADTLTETVQDDESSWVSEESAEALYARLTSLKVLPPGKLGMPARWNPLWPTTGTSPSTEVITGPVSVGAVPTGIVTSEGEAVTVVLSTESGVVAVYSAATGTGDVDTPQSFSWLMNARATYREQISQRDLYLEALQKIKQLGKYSEGWDGFDAKAPTMKAVEDAEVFIRKLRDRKLKFPYISLATDGEINFLWSQSTIHLDLGFYGDGKYSYYGRTSTGEEFLEDDVSIDASLPEPILLLLSRA
jgi:hypothetical protein